MMIILLAKEIIIINVIQNIQEYFIKKDKEG